MKTLAWIVLGFATLQGCPTPTPPNPPPQPDADAAPPGIVDAGPPAPVVVDAAPAPAVCISACANMTTLGCRGVLATCPTALANVEHDRLIVNDAGKPVSCRCIAQAATKAGVEGCGIGCR
jgi:hypothetical protein